ncbi:MAG: hypothetical protein KDA21_13365 [Phycisphaerales bacterium]|nr:hypothetical protein [Phycisphaerales bacterium]
MSRISHSVADGRPVDAPSAKSGSRWNGSDRITPAAVEPRLSREQIRSTMLRQLTREEQVLLILWYAERMEPAEIAEVLGSTPDRVQIIHDHAIAQLRDAAAA